MRAVHVDNLCSVCFCWISSLFIIHPKIELEKTFGVNFLNNMGVGVVLVMLNLPDYRL